MILKILKLDEYSEITNIYRLNEKLISTRMMARHAKTKSCAKTQLSHDLNEFQHDRIKI